MAESRRVQLTTLSCDVPPSSSSSTALDQKSPECVVVQRKRNPTDRPDKTESTVRCVLTLFESDDVAFPEFSYAQLLDKKSRHMLVKDGSPPSTFEEEDNGDKGEVAAIARKLEEKYGGSTGRKKDRIQDLVDIGYGYDDEDSFIDNSEAYDEFVPASITTKYGGFYVNSGLLQFRQTSDTETEDFTTERKTLELPKKRKLNGGQDEPKKKQRKEVGQMKTTVDSKTGTLSDIGVEEQVKKKKKKRPAGTLSVTDMLKKFQREKEKERQKKEKQKAVPIIRTPTIPLCPADAAGGGSSGFADPLLNLIGSTNDHALIQAASTVDFDIDLDSLLDVTEDNFQPKSLLHPATETQLILPSQPKTDVQTQSAIFPQAQSQPPKTKTSAQPKPQPEQTQLLSEAKTISLHHFIPLPEGLPPVLEKRIGELTMVAKTSEGESKLKFFTPEINSILLDIELRCREQGGQLRSKVYTHLSSFLPCSRETLLKRVKKLLHAHMTVPEDPMQKLAEAIGRAMPEQVARFHDNCQAHVQVKSSKAAEGKEGEQTGSVCSLDNGEEKSGKRGPQKLFRWNEEIRQCLNHVLKAKMDRYEMERKGSQEVDEYLKSFLDNEVKRLWPKGWMQLRVLLRESRKIVAPHISLPVKKAKSGKKQSVVGGVPTPSSGASDSADSNALQVTPQLKGGLCLDTDGALDEGLIPNSLPLGAAEEIDASKMAAGKRGDWLGVDISTPKPVETDKQPLSNTTSAAAAPTRSLLDLLAEQALARGQLDKGSIFQELLAEAVASACKHPVQHWSLGPDIRSPPLLPPPPPPPPQSSPVSSPGIRECLLVLPPVLQAAGFAGRGNLTKMEAISDDPDITKPREFQHGFAHNGSNIPGEGLDTGRNLQYKHI